MKARRRATRQIRLGGLAIGGGAPVSVQTMTKADTRDADACVRQIESVSAMGCDLVRLAVPDMRAAHTLADIRRRVAIPLVADIHFDAKLALAALDAGVDGLRINPGNIGGSESVAQVVRAAQAGRVPIRIGVNAGSLEKDILARHGGATPEAMVESALRHARILEELGYREIKVSAKASDVMRTVRTYRLLAEQTDYPLHLGVTEAGTLLPGTVRSSVALGILLAEGIGDTLRVSLTDTPETEVKVGLEVLRSLGLRAAGPAVISCPACGRAEVDVRAVAQAVEEGLERLYAAEPQGRRPLVAVMGCRVNGPGEAREADIALAGGRGKFALYVGGNAIGAVDQPHAVEALLEQVRRWLSLPAEP
jgi:(E)-4-hydroxy-3-methylbut-2-enyl-diphosphate synthase